jgi:SAM-dependent methyltransferase
MPLCAGGRIVRPELLDTAAPSEAARSLRDLRRINRLGGGYRLAANLVARAAAGLTTFSLLDVGAGSGDVSRAIGAAHRGASITVVDARPDHVRGIANAVAADALALPFRRRSFDIVFCSLFLHQFEDERAVRMLSSFREIARVAVCVSDLYRHPVPYRALAATRWLFRWHDITMHDGPASVAAGFRTAELASLASRAGLRQIEVRRHMPWFRLTLLGRP